MRFVHMTSDPGPYETLWGVVEADPLGIKREPYHLEFFAYETLQPPDADLFGSQKSIDEATDQLLASTFVPKDVYEGRIAKEKEITDERCIRPDRSRHDEPHTGGLAAPHGLSLGSVPEAHPG